jgi:hypothetical protein
MSSTDKDANAQARKAQVAEFEASGMTAKAWCAQNNMSTATLRYWRRKLASFSDGVKWVNIADVPFALSETTAIVSADTGAAVIHIGKATIEVFRHTDIEAVNKALVATLAQC